MDFSDLDNYRDYEEFSEMIDFVKRKPYKISSKNNPLDYMSDKDLIKRFRFSRDTILELLNLIKDKLKRKTTKHTNIIPELQLLIALRFFACGSFQLVVGECHASCQSSVSKIIKKVSHAIASLKNKFINFPTFNQAKKIRDEFYTWSKLPGVVGAIDCTHVKIKSPGGKSAEIFRNGKGNFSINVQAVCDVNLKFINLVARWPGSTHDSRIFDNSKLKADLISGNAPGYLVGDSGYACEPYLLTPYLKTATDGELRYNKAQIKCRNPIERSFGVLKKRFHCLDYKLRTKLSTSLAIISACFILHNLALDKGEPEPDSSEGESSEEDDEKEPRSTLAGNTSRKTIVNNYFN